MFLHLDPVKAFDSKKKISNREKFVRSAFQDLESVLAENAFSKNAFCHKSLLIDHKQTDPNLKTFKKIKLEALLHLPTDT